MCVNWCVFGGCVAPSQIPSTGSARRSISASKFHLKETKTHRDRKESENPGGRSLADRLKSTALKTQPKCSPRTFKQSFRRQERVR